LVENINNPSFRGRFYPVNPKRDTVLGGNGTDTAKIDTGDETSSVENLG